MPAIVSRKEAKAAGLKLYFTGKSCKNGLTAERRVNNCDCLCIICVRIRDARDLDYRNRNIVAIRCRDRIYANCIRRKVIGDQGLKMYAALMDLRAKPIPTSEEIKERKRQYHRQYAQDNIEKRREQRRKYRQSPKGKAAKARYLMRKKQEGAS